MPGTRSYLSDLPDSHYDRVSLAWRYLLGESFHYGYFETAADALDDATRALTELMADRAQLAAGQHIVDVGCGIGGPARYLARSIGCRVTGISTSAVGIGLARDETAAAGLDDLVHFEVRNGMDNGFPDEQFNRIWIMESSHLMPDKQAMLRESARVLVPGGKLVLCDIIVLRDLPIREVVRRARDFDLLRRVFGRAKMETLRRYRGWLEESGMEGLRSEDISRQTRPTFDRWQENAHRHCEPIAALIGEPAWAEFRDACDVLRALWDEGVLGYGLIAADKPSNQVL